MLLAIREIPSPVTHEPLRLPYGLLSLEMTPKFNPNGVVLSGMKMSSRVHISPPVVQVNAQKREIVITIRAIAPRVSPGTPNKAIAYQQEVLLGRIAPGKWTVKVVDSDSTVSDKPLVQQIINFA